MRNVLFLLFLSTLLATCGSSSGGDVDLDLLYGSWEGDCELDEGESYGDFEEEYEEMMQFYEKHMPPAIELLEITEEYYSVSRP